jgi:uncharacterized protein YecE (DUF72 family)
MKLYVGTSGYMYKPWKGKFYPPKLPDKEMLSFYSQHFQAVELNNTFYRMPTAAGLAETAAKVPAHFQFVIKAPQQITHIQRLKDSDTSVAQLLEAVRALKERLGPLLFQLPPNMKKDLPRLRTFLALLPSTYKVAWEFRHPSWFDEEVLDVLREQQMALCIAEAEDDLEVPCVATASWGYLRLRRPDYGDAELKAWSKRLQELPWRETYIFFKHEDEGKGPALAKRFLELAV